jgi:hypothetical protein
MMDWVKSWSRATWAMAVVSALVAVFGAAYVFGPDRVAGWGEGVWKSTYTTAPPP